MDRIAAMQVFVEVADRARMRWSLRHRTSKVP